MYNDATVQTLAALLRGGRFPHGVIFEGPPGTGRHTLAAWVARGLLCAGQGPRPCGRCAACGKVLRGVHPDLALLGQEGKAFTVDMVRQMKRAAAVRPNEADCRVFLLSDCQQMTEQAQNAFLKLLEEPEPGVYFLLLCDSALSLLPTIRSRAAVFRLAVPTVGQCLQALRTRLPHSPEEELLAAAQLAGGSIGQALLLAQDGRRLAAAGQGRALCECLARGDAYGAALLLAPCEGDREGFLQLVQGAAAYCAGAAVQSARGQGAGGMGPLQAGRILAIMEKAAQMARQNVGLPALMAVVAGACE